MFIVPIIFFVIFLLLCMGVDYHPSFQPGHLVSLFLSAIYCRACLFVIGCTELLYAAFYAPCPPGERWRNPLTTP